MITKIARISKKSNTFRRLNDSRQTKTRPITARPITAHFTGPKHPTATNAGQTTKQSHAVDNKNNASVVGTMVAFLVGPSIVLTGFGLGIVSFCKIMDTFSN